MLDLPGLEAAAVGRPNLSAWVTGLLADEARRSNEDVARALAAQAEVELAKVTATDGSIGYVRERMRSAPEALGREAPARP